MGERRCRQGEERSGKRGLRWCCVAPAFDGSLGICTMLLMHDVAVSSCMCRPSSHLAPLLIQNALTCPHMPCWRGIGVGTLVRGGGLGAAAGALGFGVRRGLVSSARQRLRGPFFASCQPRTTTQLRLPLCCAAAPRSRDLEMMTASRARVPPLHAWCRVCAHAARRLVPLFSKIQNETKRLDTGVTMGYGRRSPWSLPLMQPSRHVTPPPVTGGTLQQGFYVIVNVASLFA